MNKVNKKCSKCETIKNVSEFYKRKRNTDGLDSQCKGCIKAYNQENKGRIKTYKEENKDRIKAWREANKDKIAKHKRTYEEANKDKISERRKIYYEENKETIIFESKVRYDSAKTDYYIIYMIPNYDENGGSYVGVTNNLKYRLYQHASGDASKDIEPKQNTDKTVILHKIDDKKEAFKMERRYHNIGFDGVNSWFRRNQSA